MYICAIDTAGLGQCPVASLCTDLYTLHLFSSTQWGLMKPEKAIF
jgi:hypothetical protein